MANEVTSISADALNVVMNFVINEDELKNFVKDKDVDEIINWQTVKAGVEGAITELPGGLAAMATIPADIAATLYFQLYMVAGIAYRRGYDVKSDEVRSMMLLCLVGDGVSKIVRQFATEALTQAVRNYAIKAGYKNILVKVAERIGMKAATQSVGVKVVRLIPLIGTGVNAVYNVVSTRAIAEVAKKVFVKKHTGYR